jgi:hypothetical protein
VEIRVVDPTAVLRICKSITGQVGSSLNLSVQPDPGS